MSDVCKIIKLINQCNELHSTHLFCIRQNNSKCKRKTSITNFVHFDHLCGQHFVKMIMSYDHFFKI